MSASSSRTSRRAATWAAKTLGEFIFCTDEEQRAINEQRVNYDYLWRILEAVRPDEGSG